MQKIILSIASLTLIALAGSAIADDDSPSSPTHTPVVVGPPDTVPPRHDPNLGVSEGVRAYPHDQVRTTRSRRGGARRLVVGGTGVSR